jgi:hypothetical protein
LLGRNQLVQKMITLKMDLPGRHQVLVLYQLNHNHHTLAKA